MNNFYKATIPQTYGKKEILVEQQDLSFVHKKFKWSTLVTASSYDY